MKITPEQIAGIIHEANRQLRIVLGESPGPHWMECDPQMRETTVNGVIKAQAGATPEELHEEWVALKGAQGWTIGQYKDVRRRKHPCMVPYDELPPEQQLKDQMFHAMVHVLSQGRVAILTDAHEAR